MDIWLEISLQDHLVINFPTIIHIHLYMLMQNIWLHRCARIHPNQLVENIFVNFEAMHLQLLQRIVSCLCIT